MVRRRNLLPLAMVLLIGAQAEAVQTMVCRTQDEVLATGEEWAAMVDKGWR